MVAGGDRTTPEKRGGRLQGMRAGAGILVIWLVAAVSAGASDEIYLSEFTAIVQDWHPQSEVDLSPPRETDMVIYEVTRFPHLVEPSPEQMAAAGAFWERARAAVRARGWDDFERAVADGFELMFGDDNHYASREHVADGRVLDPERPEFLIYYESGGAKRLAGLMFLAEPDTHGPQIAGPMAVWHFHLWSEKLCLWRGLLVDGLADGEGCPDGGVASHRSPEMLHLWFFDHSQGMFATGMDLEPFEIRELEEIEF